MNQKRHYLGISLNVIYVLYFVFFINYHFTIYYPVKLPNIWYLFRPCVENCPLKDVKWIQCDSYGPRFPDP